MIATFRLTLLLFIALIASSLYAPPLVGSPALNMLVQSKSIEQARAAVAYAGGEVLRDLPIIAAVEAQLPPIALKRLQALPDVQVYTNHGVRSAHSLASTTAAQETDTAGYTLYPAAAVGVTNIHEQQVTSQKVECKDQQVIVQPDQESRPHRGYGVTVAIIDSGFVQMASQGDWKHRLSDGTLIAENSGRCVIYRDFLPRTRDNENAGNRANNSVDQHGHGTHIAATITDNREVVMVANSNATPVGVAPQANLLIARALDKNGAGTYSDVIAAIDWVVANKARYNVGVLNLSLYAPVIAPYWADPLGQAVMRAWQAGIVVVVAAGNDGPGAGTITVPGNVPYVITVGAVRSGRYSVDGSDALANYSSRGPTESAFVKPDVVVPASRTIAPLPHRSTLDMQLTALAQADRCRNDAPDPGPINAEIPSYCWYENARIDLGVGATAQSHGYYQLSGTSMAAAQVSGIVALMLQAAPQLTNNQIKARLIETARPATDLTTNLPIYTVWEQGAGLIDAPEAINHQSDAVANSEMDIALDLQTFTDGRDEQHYWGNTIWDEASGQFRLVDPTTGTVLEVWDGRARAWFGGSRAWFGGSRAWFGGSRAWFGGSRAWFGGSRAWFGGASLWAGNSRPWLGPTLVPSPASEMRSDAILDDRKTEMYNIFVPIVSR
jgi:serine protease AprX